MLKCTSCERDSCTMLYSPHPMERTQQPTEGKCQVNCCNFNNNQTRCKSQLEQQQTDFQTTKGRRFNGGGNISMVEQKEQQLEANINNQSLCSPMLSSSNGSLSPPTSPSNCDSHSTTGFSRSRSDFATSAPSEHSPPESASASITPSSSSSDSNSSSGSSGSPSIGVNLRVTGQCSQGGRKYMEDFFSVAYQQTENEKDLEYAFVGIYDGHGGAEAATFAKEHLMMEIINQKLFWSNSDQDVLRAIREGYIATHYAMWRDQENWPKTTNGLPSTAGTTATVAFIRREKLYIGHVGDSGIVLGYQNENENFWRAKQLTVDHKPESSVERARIMRSGGKVVVKSGVPRVVWSRPRDATHRGPVRRNTLVDEIPFLAVARSLGDLWSYNSACNEFVVSPDPDVTVIKINPKTFKCLIFGTDGLWNVVTPQEAVDTVFEKESINLKLQEQRGETAWTNPSKGLVEKALKTWSSKKMRADNTSVVTVILYPPGSTNPNGNSCNASLDRSSIGLQYTQLQAEIPTFDDATTFKQMAEKYLPPEEFRNFDYFAEDQPETRIEDEGMPTVGVEVITPPPMGFTSAVCKPQPTISRNGSGNGVFWSELRSTLEGKPRTGRETFDKMKMEYIDARDILERGACMQNIAMEDVSDDDGDDDDDMSDESSDEDFEDITPSGVNETSIVMDEHARMDTIHHQQQQHQSITCAHHRHYTHYLTDDCDSNVASAATGRAATALVEARGATSAPGSGSSDGAGYMHSFAESYNSLLTEQMAQEASTSNSNASCKSISGRDMHEILQEQQLYQQQCMSEEEGYSLTKLETRGEQQRCTIGGGAIGGGAIGGGTGSGSSRGRDRGNVGVQTFKIFQQRQQQQSQSQRPRKGLETDDVSIPSVVYQPQTAVRPVEADDDDEETPVAIAAVPSPQPYWYKYFGMQQSPTQKPLELNSLLEQEREEEQQVALEQLAMQQRITMNTTATTTTSTSVVEYPSSSNNAKGYVLGMATEHADCNSNGSSSGSNASTNSTMGSPSLGLDESGDIEYLDDDLTFAHPDESVQIHEISSSSGVNGNSPEVTEEAEAIICDVLRPAFIEEPLTDSGARGRRSETPPVIESIESIEIIVPEEVETKSECEFLTATRICPDTLSAAIKRAQSQHEYPNIPNENQRDVPAKATTESSFTLRRPCRFDRSTMMTRQPSKATAIIGNDNSGRSDKRSLRSSSNCNSFTAPMAVAMADFSKRTLRTRNSLGKDMKAKAASGALSANVRRSHGGISVGVSSAVHLLRRSNATMHSAAVAPGSKPQRQHSANRQPSSQRSCTNVIGNRAASNVSGRDCSGSGGARNIKLLPSHLAAESVNHHLSLTTAHAINLRSRRQVTTATSIATITPTSIAATTIAPKQMQSSPAIVLNRKSASSLNFRSAASPQENEQPSSRLMRRDGRSLRSNMKSKNTAVRAGGGSIKSLAGSGTSQSYSKSRRVQALMASLSAPAPKLMNATVPVATVTRSRTLMRGGVSSGSGSGNCSSSGCGEGIKSEASSARKQHQQQQQLGIRLSSLRSCVDILHMGSSSDMRTPKGPGGVVAGKRNAGSSTCISDSREGHENLRKRRSLSFSLRNNAGGCVKRNCGPDSRNAPSADVLNTRQNSSLYATRSRVIRNLKR